MQCDPAKPSHLRRRHQAFQNQRQHNGFRSSTTETSLDGPNGLELSMHLPSARNRNRFEALSSMCHPPKQATAASSTRSSSYYPRHPCTSRGTREAKRRRDARRNQRKLLAAQELDERLSREIDKTLTSANIYRPPHLRLPAPKPPPKGAGVDDSRPTQAPLSPPQLPWPDFGRLDFLWDFPQPARLPPSPAPSFPAPFSPRISSWCPSLPSLARDKCSSADLPLFFDLSSLPEPFQTPKPTSECRELQLWRPKANSQPVKHSRFFPPRSCSPKSSVKLSTACTLHKNDKGVQVELPPKPEHRSFVAKSIKQTDKFPEFIPDNGVEASAANLWKILTSKNDTYKDAAEDPYVNSFNTQRSRDRLAAPAELFDTRMYDTGMPTELDDTQIPYTHANSLTGHGNERATYPQRDIEEHRTVIYDPPMTVTSNDEMFPRVNEMVVDHDVYGEGEEQYWDAWEAAFELPALPTSPVELEADVPDSFDMSSTNDNVVAGPSTPVDSVLSPRVITSDHFHSEQSLFNPAPSPLQPISTPSSEPERDFIDVATFLELGHVPDCWCRPCQQMYEDDNEFDLSSPTETEEWMVCQAGKSEDAWACEAWEWECGSLAGAGGEGMEWEVGEDGEGWDLSEDGEGLWAAPSCKAHEAW